LLFDIVIGIVNGLPVVYFKTW